MDRVVLSGGATAAAMAMCVLAYALAVWQTRPAPRPVVAADSGRSRGPGLDRQGADSRTVAVALGVAVVVVGVLGVIGPVALIGPAAAFAALRARRRRLRLRLEARRSDELAVVVDLMRVAVLAGLAPGAALAAAVGSVRPDRDAELGTVLDTIERGEPLTEALQSWHERLVGSASAARLGPQAQEFVSLVRGASVSGVSIAAGLDQLADDLRRRRRHEAHRQARRLPVTMLLPLVCCVLPAFALLTVVPMVVVGLEVISDSG